MLVLVEVGFELDETFELVVEVISLVLVRVDELEVIVIVKSVVVFLHRQSSMGHCSMEVLFVNNEASNAIAAIRDDIKNSRRIPR